MEFFDSPDSDWDKRILKSELGRYHQTTLQAKHLSAFRNYKPIFVLFQEIRHVEGVVETANESYVVQTRLSL